MKRLAFISLAVLLTAMFLLVACVPLAPEEGEEEEGLVTVLNPICQQAEPAKEIHPLAPRLDTLDGKTIYLVDSNYGSQEVFFETLKDVLAEEYPNTTFIYAVKQGTYFRADKALWAEIEENGDGVILGVGH